MAAKKTAAGKEQAKKRKAGGKTVRSLDAKQSSRVRGGAQQIRKGGDGGGNTAGAWDLTGNKVHA